MSNDCVIKTYITEYEITSLFPQIYDALWDAMASRDIKQYRAIYAKCYLLLEKIQRSYEETIISGVAHESSTST